MNLYQINDIAETSLPLMHESVIVDPEPYCAWNATRENVRMCITATLEFTVNTCVYTVN